MLHDMIIIGGGCAGLSASIYARRYNMDVVVLTEGLGGTITTTHLVENYPGFTSVSGQELADAFINHAKANDVPFRLGSRVTRVWQESSSGKDPIFKVQFGVDVHEARTVLLATGTTYRKLDVPGEAELASKGVSYCATCDAPFYKGKNVIIVGGGDSSVKESLILAEHAKQVTIVYRGEKITKAEPINMKRVEATPNIAIRLKANIVEILGDKRVQKVKFDDGSEMDVDGVFIEIGRIPLTDMVNDLGVEKNEKGEIKINLMSETSIPGFYAAGDVADTEWKQAIVSADEGCKAAFRAFEFVSAQKAKQ
ncbi:FAD-dependent oxidoreductase [Candidatus Peregrinibacteria bacterium]|nr:MAG: FAD-dependent oxidoreductase [Candidatus Peregrinibacteria bacterium]